APQEGGRAARGGLPSERPRTGAGDGMSTNGSQPLLEVEDLVASYPVGRGVVGAVTRAPTLEVHAVDGVSFSLNRGGMLALVGESGCGKTSTAQSVLRLIQTSGGSIRFDGQEITGLSFKALRPRRPGAASDLH